VTALIKGNGVENDFFKFFFYVGGHVTTLHMEDLWHVTSSQFPTIDEFITISNPDAVEPVRKLKDKAELENWSHIQSLSV